MANISQEKIHELNEYGRRFSDATVLLHLQIAQYAGLAPADHKYLSMLMQKGAMTAGELAQASGLTTGAVTGLIDRLEKKGLVERKADANDRRKVLIVPNLQKAGKLFGSVFGALQERLTALVEQYSDKELKVVKSYIGEAVKIMEELTEELKKGKK